MLKCLTSVIHGVGPDRKAIAVAGRRVIIAGTIFTGAGRKIHVAGNTFQVAGYFKPETWNQKPEKHPPNPFKGGMKPETSSQ
jgi:hypothetical protein